MPRPSEDDREAIDRAFADLVAGYHLTSDRPDPLLDSAGLRDQASSSEPAAEVAPEVEASPSATSTEATSTATEAGAGWADDHPLFRYVEPADVAEPAAADDEFVPEPLMPLPRPGWPVLLAWIAMGYAVLAVLAEAMGLRLPAWAGWAALIGFIGGFALLVTRLPRYRDPDAGNGAVL